MLAIWGQTSCMVVWSALTEQGWSGQPGCCLSTSLSLSPVGWLCSLLLWGRKTYPSGTEWPEGHIRSRPESRSQDPKSHANNTQCHRGHGQPNNSTGGWSVERMSTVCKQSGDISQLKLLTASDKAGRRERGKTSQTMKKCNKKRPNLREGRKAGKG